MQTPDDDDVLARLTGSNVRLKENLHLKPGEEATVIDGIQIPNDDVKLVLELTHRILNEKLWSDVIPRNKAAHLTLLKVRDFVIDFKQFVSLEGDV